MDASWSAKRWSTRPGARGQQAAEVRQAGLQAEGDELRALIRCVQAERVGGRRLRVGEKQAVEDAEQAASLGGAAPDKILHERVVAQRRAQ